MNAQEKEIAETILRHVGRRALFMLGAKHILRDGPDLTFRIRGSQNANAVHIHLAGNDTYTISFFKVRQLKRQLVASESGVYCDMLHAMIEKHTGLRTSL